MNERALLLAIVLAGCDLGPYPDLQEPIDPFLGLTGSDSTTYLAADSESSTFLVLSGPTLDDRRFTWTYVPVGNGRVVITAGAYETEDGVLTLNGEQEFVREPFEQPLGDREGSTRREIDRLRVFDFVIEQELLTLTDENGVVLELENLDSVISRVGSVSPEAVTALYSVAEASSQTRVVGFGTAAMIEYSTPAVFRATLSGEFTVSLDGLLSPEVSFDYDRTSDFTGVVIDGPQFSSTDISGDGYTHGTVDYELWHQGDSEPFFTAQIYYGAEDGSEGVVVTDGSPTGGEYVLRRGDREDAIPVDVFVSRDLSGWFASP